TTVDSEPSTKIPPTLRPARRTSLGHFRLTDSPRTRRAATPATSGIRDIAGCGQSVTNPTDTAIPRGAVIHRAPDLPRPWLWRWATTTAGRPGRAPARARSWVDGTTSCTSSE